MDYEPYQTINSMNGHSHRSNSRGGGMDDYIVQEHIDSMNAQLSSTRAQRIRAAIFPETLEDRGSDGLSSIPIPSTQFVNGQPTAVQKLSEPSQLLKNAVIDIINYKEDAEITEKALPELIRLLNDDDPVVAGQAALILHTLSKKEASRLALCTPQMIQALIQSLSNPRATDETRRGVAGVLHSLSQQKQGLLIIFKGGGIPLLVRLLEYDFVSFFNEYFYDFISSSSNESIVNYALSTLHNLLLHLEHAKLEILRCGGCQKMVGLLNNTNPKFLAILTDCLHMLAFNNEEVKVKNKKSEKKFSLSF
jgi:hypothetical protein